jgi:hypothetical protein
MKCSHCLGVFPQVYTVWTCLNTSCSVFDTINGQIVPAEQREYNKKLLTYDPTSEDHIDTVDMSLTNPMTSSNDLSTSAVFKQGFYCKPCGRLSSRYKWREWECRVCGVRCLSFSRNPGLNLPQVKQIIQGKLQNASDVCLRSRGDAYTIDSPDGMVSHLLAPLASTPE